MLKLLSHYRTHFEVVTKTLRLVLGRTAHGPKGWGIFGKGGGLSTTANPERSICGQEARQAANNVDRQYIPKCERNGSRSPNGNGTTCGSASTNEPQLSPIYLDKG